MRAADPSLISDFYWIAPDGLGNGDESINVYYDMKPGNKYTVIFFHGFFWLKTPRI